MQCRLNQEKYLRKYSVKKHKEKPDRVYLAYKKVDNNRIEKEKRKVANDYLTQTSLISKCKVLKEYVILTTRMREYISKYSGKDFSDEEAVKMAVDECINENVLREFLLENKAEVVKMFLTEYNEKQTLENTYNDGVEVGKEIGKSQGIEFGERRKLVEMVYKKIKRGKSVEEIADDLEEDIEVINPIFNEIEKLGLDKSLEEIMEHF